MYGKSKYWVRCSYGCCDAYRDRKSRRTIKRSIRAIENKTWRNDD